MTIGALSFLSPWLLTGLVALPIIYWLLRTVPPRPKQIAFPPTRILVGLENREKTPDKTPWWLMLIRLLAAALIIFALAEPILNPNKTANFSASLHRNSSRCCCHRQWLEFRCKLAGTGPHARARR